MSAARTPEQQKFIVGYLTAALWSSTDTNPETEETFHLDDFEWGAGMEDKLAEDCIDFMVYQAQNLARYAVQYRPAGVYDVWECAGHDFWLTRAGHGVGYWDRGLGQLGDDLTTATKTFGGIDLYLGDDRLVWS